jgi:tetratricopeptide (TPR) repeat protein
MTLEQLQPYLTVATTVFSLASLAFILSLIREVRENAKERAALMKDRLDGAQEELQRTEKWNQREQSRLREELDRLKDQLNAALSKEGLSPQALAVGRDLREAATEVRAQIQGLVNEMQQKLSAFKSDGYSAREPAWGLALARGEMAAGRPGSAAKLFDEYGEEEDPTWESHFVRGVAHANAREGTESDITALRAYNEALVLAPANLNQDMQSRLHGYRGAILKRLGRLLEAEADLQLALKLATSTEERHDALYNLAGVYALGRDRNRMLEAVRVLKDNDTYKGAIRAHLDDYFALYARDPELLSMLQ